MPVISENLYDKKQTIKRMFEICRKYHGDLNDIFISYRGKNIALSDLPLQDFFNFVKSIPFLRDDDPVEIVARPKIIIENYLSGIGKDCKKAAVLIGSYLEAKKIPWRLATISTNKNKQIHHIFPQADFYNNGEYLNLDATYNYMKMFGEKEVTRVEYFL